MYKNYANPFELLDDDHYYIDIKIKKDIDIKKCVKFVVVSILYQIL